MKTKVLFFSQVLILALTAVVMLTGNLMAQGSLHYSNPNQTYDRLPGTLETWHIKWAKPSATGKLNVLFIIPYFNSREVVEAAQRLEMNYAWIMCANNLAWYYENASLGGAGGTPLLGVEARTILDDLSKQRLGLDKNYDVIVIAKISWAVIPDFVRELILKHVERGTGLVYLTPNRYAARISGESISPDKESGEDAQFKTLFQTDTEKGVAESLLSHLPLDVMRFHVIEKPIAYKSDYNRPFFYRQIPVCITATSHNKGRVIGLHYFDEKTHGSASLSCCLADLEEQDVIYDLSYALLARCLLWSAHKAPDIETRITFNAPATDLQAPLDQKSLDMKLPLKPKAPAVIIARDDLDKAKATVKITTPSAKTQKCQIAFAIRSMDNKEIKSGALPVEVSAANPAEAAIALPALCRGTYVLDARILDGSGRVMDFASAGFRVENPRQVAAIKTGKEAYKEGEEITGEVTFNAPLPAGEKAEVWAVDTWGRVTVRTEATLNEARDKASFNLPVHAPLCRLWDIHAGIRDANGFADEAKTWVGLPNWTFDDYMCNSFYPIPADWKGKLIATVLRPYGLNAIMNQLLYGNDLEERARTERYHLQSIEYAASLGEIIARQSYEAQMIVSNKEDTTSDIAEVSRMCRSIADTGKLLDPKEFPYQWPQGGWALGADHINRFVNDFQDTTRFGTAFYILATENYMFGEFAGLEFSGFAPECTKRFQAWCKEQYKNDLGALNAEWGSDLKSWDEVRGILLQDAVEKNQLPRWVDFRYFMRSRVWSQLFLDWTAMMQRFVPEVRTGKIGHDHHDLSRYRDAMNCAKLYICPQPNIEWGGQDSGPLARELLQSFSGDKSILLASYGSLSWGQGDSWDNPIIPERWPWKILFMGLRGFDWERWTVQNDHLGGESCITPDFSELIPHFKTLTGEILSLQQGVGKLTIASKPYRSKVAILWAPYNHYISRLDPFQEKGFTGTWLYNIMADGGAPSDCLGLLQSIRIRPTMVAPEDLANNGLKKRGFKALFLPYNKGMSEEEAEAIKTFVKDGGLVIAENTPGIYSQHGKELKTPRLKELFPSFEGTSVVAFGKGHAAYVPHDINGYLARFTRNDYRGAETVAALLKEYAGEEPPMELLAEDGTPRRDTLMPVFIRGSTQLLGLLRNSRSEGKTGEGTKVKLRKGYHVWDIRNHKYIGFKDEFDVKLDMHPQYYALMAVNPTGLELKPESRKVKQGGKIKLIGRVKLEGGSGDEAAKAGQAAHVRVYSPKGEELEWYRQNIVFDGDKFEVTLPVSYSEEPGQYRVEAEHVLTGMKAKAEFKVTAKD